MRLWSVLLAAALVLSACALGSTAPTATSHPAPSGVAGATLVNPPGTMGSQMPVWASKGIKVPTAPGARASGSTILGSDVSEFQGAASLSPYNRGFIIIREQYGTAGLDKQFVHYRDEARARELPRFFYHYAYPQFNSPDAEARVFANGTNWTAGEGAMLDFEEQFGDPVGWSLRFLQVFESIEHFKPVVYLNVFELYKYNWAPVSANGNGIIVAQWNFNLNPPPSGAFAFAAGKQYTDAEIIPGFDGRVDGDVWFGDVASFERYGFLGPIPTPGPVVPPPAPTPAPPVSNCSHTVQSGETLSGIVGDRWPSVAAGNGISNPNLIFVGEIINTCAGGTPAPAPSGCVIIQSGQTLSGVFGARWPQVARANGIRNPNLIFVGQRVCG